MRESVYAVCYKLVYDLTGQISKGARGIPRCCQPMKDVAGCEKSGRVAKQTLTPECLNGETHCSEAAVSYAEHIGVVKVSG